MKCILPAILLILCLLSCKKRDIVLLSQSVKDNGEVPKVFRDFDPEGYCSSCVELIIRNTTNKELKVRNFSASIIDPISMRIKYKSWPEITETVMNRGFIKNKKVANYTLILEPKLIDTFYTCNYAANPDVEEVWYNIEYYKDGSIYSQVLE